MFCPKCKSLMFPEEGKLRCRKEGCGFEREIGKEESLTIKETPKEMSEFLVLDDITETLPKTRIECPECGHDEAYWMMRQTRAADEPTTRIYRCAKCKHTWREF